MAQAQPQYNPLYQQTRDIIYRRILDSTYRIGQGLPSESSLAKEFGVSVATIRQAVGLLVNEGLLLRRQGKGTYVTDNPIVLRFLGWIGEYREGRDTVERIIRTFERKNPNIKIEYLSAHFEGVKQIFLEMVQEGRAPDVVQLVSHWTSGLASMGLLEPLADLLPGSNLANRLPDKDLAGGTYRNNLFSVAWGICPMALIYNRKLLRDAGVEMPTQLTLDDFHSICRQIGQKLRPRGVHSFGLCRDVNLFLFTYSFILAFNGEVIDDTGQIVLDSPEVEAAFAWLRRLATEANLVWTDDIWQLRHLLAEDRLVFLEDGPWIRGILKDYSGHHDDFDEYFGVIENPVGPASKFTSWNYNHALAITSMSRRKDTAVKFISALTSDPEICNLYFHEAGLLPPVRSMLSEASYAEHVYYQPFIRQLDRTRMIRADNPLVEKAIQFIADGARNILVGNKDIRRELREKAYYLRMLYK